MNLAFKPVPKVGEMDAETFLNAYMIQIHHLLDETFIKTSWNSIY